MTPVNVVDSIDFKVRPIQSAALNDRCLQAIENLHI